MSKNVIVLINSAHTSSQSILLDSDFFNDCKNDVLSEAISSSNLILNNVVSALINRRLSSSL